MVLYAPAARMIGVPNKKEKRVAAIGDSLANNPPVIVIPDLDVPGNRAIAWAQPIKSTWFSVILLISDSFEVRLSE